MTQRRISNSFPSFGFDVLLDSLPNMHSKVNYPPYNLVRTENNGYRIELAVAGFKREELKVALDKANGVLTVEGQHDEAQSEDEKFLHRGIGARSFSLSFRISDSIETSNIKLVDGILRIEMFQQQKQKDSPQLLTIN